APGSRLMLRTHPGRQRPHAAPVPGLGQDVLPPKTVYSLTGFGRDLAAALDPVAEWGHRRLELLREREAAS
ncbi:winged helix-turn-helix transcriptional regulator, partial [Streptomyces tricolor]